MDDEVPDDLSLEQLREEFEPLLRAFTEELASREYSLSEWLTATADPDPMVRVYALQTTLAPSPTGRRLRRSKQVARRLVELLSDADLRIRATTAVTLWEVRTAEALPGLQALVRSEDWHIRCQAAGALGYQRGPRALEILREALRVETEPQALPWYARSLGHTREASAVPDLLRLSRHADWQVRYGAADALDELRHPETARLVEELAADPAAPQDELVYLQRLRRRLARRAAATRRRAASPDA